CFSSRRRHTRWPRDWSSDVCSSDLGFPPMEFLLALLLLLQDPSVEQLIGDLRSGDVDTRAKARIQLKKLGKAAIPALEAASREEIGRASCRERVESGGGVAWGGERR